MTDLRIRNLQGDLSCGPLKDHPTSTTPRAAEDEAAGEINRFVEP